MITRRTFTAGLLAAAAFAALSTLPASAAERLNVFAAASLKNALDEVSAAWKAGTGKEATNTFAASSALARQIESGAPADIFISEGSVVQLLGNTLVLVAPAGSKAAVTIAPGFDLAGLLNGGKLAMGDVKAVPAGKYGKAALETLGVWTAVEGSLAQAENVRAALKLVATAEAPAGIVYGTDAVEDKAVRVLGTFPADSHPPIIYPAAITAASQNADATEFLAFLRSPAAQDIFKAHGFTIIGN